MVVVRRRPFFPLQEFDRVQRTMNRLFDEGLVRPIERRWSECGCLPIDVYTTPEAFVIQSNVPGVKPEDVHVTIEGDVLTIKATLAAEVEGAEYSVRERASGEHERTLSFNVPIQPEAVEAAFENGVLTLTVPKAEEVKPKKIEIKSH